MKHILFLLIALFVYVPQVEAATYYADDAGSGVDCTFVSPCTLSYALVTKISTGDTVKVMPGTYTSSTQIAQKAAATGIIVESYDYNDQAIIDGSTLTQNSIIFTSGGTYQYLIFKDSGKGVSSPRAALRTTDTAPSVIVQYNTFINCGHAFMYSGVADVFRYNYVDRVSGGSVCFDGGQDAGEQLEVYNNIILSGGFHRRGSATGGDADTLIDTGIIWATAGAYSGSVMKNITDGSWGLVESFSGTTLEIDGNMSSGAWDATDKWHMLGASGNDPSYTVSIPTVGDANYYNNFLGGMELGGRITGSGNGVINIKNNIFSGTTAGFNIDSFASGSPTITLSNNLYNNAVSIGNGTVEFEQNLDGVTDSGLSQSTNWGVDQKIDLPDTYFFYRFDDADYEICADCTDNYFKDIANKMLPYGQKATVGIDVATVGVGGATILTWAEINELQATYDWEIAAHGLSHIPLNLSPTNVATFAVTGPGDGSIVVNIAGTAPTDSGTIVIAEGANSLTITYPALSSLLYTAIRTAGSDNDPWDYSIINSGMDDPAAFDLGATQGLRNYINSLTNWSATVQTYTGGGNSPSRMLANDTYAAPSSTAINLDVTKTHYWEITYPKAVVENQVSGYTCNTLIYPFFVFDYQTIKSINTAGYTSAMGTNMTSGQNVLDGIHTFNLGTFPIGVVILADTYDDGTDGEEEDIRHAMRSMVTEGAASRRIVGLMSHNRSDVDSMDQWDYIISEVAASGFVSVTVPSDIVGTIKAGGSGWTVVDSYNILWEKTTWDKIAPSPLVGSLAINNATNVGLTSDIIGTAIPQGGTPDIGAYEYIFTGGGMMFNTLLFMRKRK